MFSKFNLLIRITSKRNSVMNWVFLARWSPWLVGIGIGVLVWLGFLLSNRAIGCSTAYARTGGIIESFIRGKSVKNREYFRKFVPKIDWEWMLVLGVIVGAFAAAVLSGSFALEVMPDLWRDAFGGNVWLRIGAALAGGVCIGFGARMAGGCTSGHGISGTLQLAVGSWMALCCFFLGGILTAWVVIAWLGGA